MDARQIRAALKNKFTDCSVVVEESEYTYLHHDAVAFEIRTLQAMRVRVTGKKVTGYTFKGKPLYNQPDAVSVVDYLRSMGQCAEYCYAGRWQAYVIYAQDGQWPVNISSGIGAWHLQEKLS